MLYFAYNPGSPLEGFKTELFHLKGKYESKEIYQAHGMSETAPRGFHTESDTISAVLLLTAVAYFTHSPCRLAAYGRSQSCFH